MDLQLGPYLIHPAANRVSRDGQDLHVTPKAMEVLVCLMRHEGQVVSKDELIREVWGETFVSDDSLVRCVVELRKVFGDDARHPTMIETIPKRGYRLVAAMLSEQSGPLEEDRPNAVQLQEAPAPPKVNKPRRGAIAAGAAVVGSVLLAAGAGPVWNWWQAYSSRPKIRRILVLPLVNLSQGAHEDYFSEGMTESLIVELSHIRELSIISRTSAMRYKGSGKALPEIAREVGVTGIVAGTVARSGERVRITAVLIDTATEVNLWSGSFERDMSDVLSLQSEIARSIAAELNVNLSEGPVPIQTHHRIVPEAYESFLKGRYFLERREFAKSADHLEAATRRDPKFALAHAFLFEADSMLTFLRDEPPSSRATNALRRATELDSSLAEVHSGQGDVAFWWYWRWEEGEAEFHRAVQIDPSSSLVAAHYASCLHVQRRWREATAEYQRAITTDPASLRLNQSFLQVLIDSRRDQAAAEQFRKVNELDPNNFSVWDYAADMHAAAGRESEALQCWLKALRMRGIMPAELTNLEQAANRDGVRGYWSKRLEHIGQNGGAIYLAAGYIRAGQHDAAIRIIEGAFRQRAPQLPWVNARAVFEPLRSDPRFQSVLERMRLIPSSHRGSVELRPFRPAPV